jgi:large subunit ribosomal protein L21
MYNGGLFWSTRAQRGCDSRKDFINYTFLGIRMYAVVKTGGKQYRVAAGQKIKVEQITADIGQEVSLSEVLAVGSGEGIVLGTPLVAGATVTAMVVSHGRHDKVRIFKMRRRKHYQKHQGHRQNFTELFIKAIAGAGLSAAAAAPVAAGKPDDLTKIEGIGPKINELFQTAGIKTFADLASAKVERLSEILHAAGARFASHNPGTWPEQAALARDGKWAELKTWQDALDGGKQK